MFSQAFPPVVGPDGKVDQNALGRKLVLGGTILMLSGAYVWHRQRMNAVIEMSQAAVRETMIGSFNEGVKYGMEVSKEFFKDLSNQTSMEELYNLGKPLAQGTLK